MSTATNEPEVVVSERVKGERRLGLWLTAPSFLMMILVTALLVWGPIRLMESHLKDTERLSQVDMPSYGGVLANSYLPSNWVSALSLYGWTQVDESLDTNELIDPAKKFTYVAPKDIDDTYLVFVIGETTRWDHMSLFGYGRDTTPGLAKRA